jgi:hypothetical protein
MLPNKIKFKKTNTTLAHYTGTILQEGSSSKPEQNTLADKDSSKTSNDELLPATASGSVVSATGRYIVLHILYRDREGQVVNLSGKACRA